MATCSLVGAAFGYGLSWTLLFSYPLMVAIQIISARVGPDYRVQHRRHAAAASSGLAACAGLVCNGLDAGDAVLIPGRWHAVGPRPASRSEAGAHEESGVPDVRHLWCRTWPRCVIQSGF